MLLLLLFYFSLAQVVHCFCPEGFQLVSEGQCRGLNSTIPGPSLRYMDAPEVVFNKCREMQAQPIAIHNEEEQSYWGKESASIQDGHLIIGLTCNDTSKEWQWMDGSLMDFKPYQYDPNLDRPCTSICTWCIATTGDWYSFCNNTATQTSPYYVYCTKQIPVVNPPNDCENFTEDNDDGVCYQIGTTAESWQDAQLACKKLGANLASIHNANENSFVRRLAVSKGAVHGVFLGATVSGKGGNYGWIDGSEWDYTNFYPGFPKTGYGECVALDTSVTSGQWMNVECSSEIPVACIREKITPIVRNSTCSYDSVTEGTIMTSPGFPYDASMPCDYYLEADEGKKVEVEIAILEANSCCDSLILYEGYFGGFILANLTGEIRNQTFTTDSNKMRVSWQPNGGVNVRGLAMTFRGV